MLLSLTPQEIKIINYLQDKKQIFINELFQFSKPDVKVKTLRRAISEIKNKYKQAGMSFPETEIVFDVKDTLELETALDEVLIDRSPKENEPVLIHNPPSAPVQPAYRATSQLGEQMLIQYKKKTASEIGGTVVVTAKIDPKKLEEAVKQPAVEQKQFQTDFKLNFNNRQVNTKHGIITLDNVEDWELMKYFHSNPERDIPIEELKDIYWHNYGSKTPSRWMDAILRRVNKLRRAIPLLVGRIITIPDQKLGTYFLVR